MRRSLLAAFLWLRWRMLVNGLRASGRRGPLRLFAAWGEVLLQGVLAVLGTVAALALAVGAGFAVHGLAQGGVGRELVLMGLRIAAGTAIVVLLVVPAIQGSLRGGGTSDRLLLLPLSRRTLHALQLGAALADPWLLLTVPAILVLGVGAAVFGAPAAALGTLGALLFVLALAALSTCAAYAAQLLFRDRRRAELAVVAMVVAWILIAVAPNLLEQRARRHREARPAAAAERPAAAAPAETQTAPQGGDRGLAAADVFPLWLQVVPSEAFGRTLAGVSAGRLATAAGGVGSLACEAALFYLLSAALWQRLVTSPETSSGRRGRAARPLPARRLPGLDAAESAVAWTHARTFWRTVQGKLAVVIPAVMALMFDLLAERAQSRGGGFFALALESGALALGVAGMAVIAQQALLINQFATDGSGLVLEALLPLDARALLRGKAVGGALVAGVSMAGALLVLASLETARPPLLWPAALLGGLGAYALLAPLGAWLSILLPKAVDLSRLGGANKPHQGAALLSMPAIAACLAPAVGLHLLATQVLHSPALGVAFEAVWLVVAVLLARPLLDRMAGFLARRREGILLTLRDRG